ncbi:MAG TPA: hypothetical protein VHR45_09190 [Thermoanaerobaculia bacterium]|nr:hypothetical protein [Thermoanaerobaculia bacterium]
MTAVPRVAGALASLGDALHAKVLAVDWKVLTISDATTAADVAKAQADLVGQRARLDLLVDKKVLIQNLGLTHSDSQVALFLSPEALARELEQPLDQLEGSVLGWASDRKKLIVVVGGCAVFLNGEHLAVVGSEAPEGWAAAVPPATPSDARIVALREQAFRSAIGPGAVNWYRFKLKELTPVHLALDPKTSSATPGVGTLLRSHLLRIEALLSIVYTASQVTAPDDPKPATGGPAGDWVATYAAEGTIATVSWSDAGVAAATAGLEEGAATLGDLARWAYEPGSGDRLTVVRDVVARSLIGNDPRDNYRLLVGQAAAFWDRAQSSWNAFIDGKLDKYFGHVHELEQVMDATVKAASEQVDGLTKSLIDSALAAVGVIVASFLAAVFKEKFDPAVYRLGVGAYVFYLVVFPGLAGLTASAQRFKALQRGLAERRESFRHRLSDDEVEKTMGEGFKSVTRRYWGWFSATSLAFLALAILLLWSLSAVPRLVASAPRGAPAVGQAPPAAQRAAPTPPRSREPSGVQPTSRERDREAPARDVLRVESPQEALATRGLLGG